jgi:hypothetical protein
MTATGDGHALAGGRYLGGAHLDEALLDEALLDEALLDGGWFEVAPDGVDEGVDDPHDPHVAPDAPRPPRLRVARPTSRDVLRRRRRARLAVFAVAALSAASMFTLVAFHVFAAQAAFSLHELDTTLSSDQREYGLLRAEVAALSSPDAVESGALSLGMVRPSEVTLLNAPVAAAFGSHAGLPVPPPTPYNQIVVTRP